LNQCTSYSENTPKNNGLFCQNYMSELPGSDAVCTEMNRLAAKYPFIKLSEFGRSAMGRPLLCICAGSGGRHVFFSASHHANEWITSSVLLKFMNELFENSEAGVKLYGLNVSELLSCASLYFAPLINPDGVDLVLGNITGGEYYNSAKKIADKFPMIPFPSGWKANIDGIDLNLQYPAGWERAKTIKYAQGFCGPAPRDFVGISPLSAPESSSLYDFTRSISPDVVLALHAQGREIYWKFGDSEPEGARALGLRMSEASGYSLSETPPLSDNAGFKDWFIQEYKRPGYTVEMGEGENPLPMEQFNDIYADVAPMFYEAALGL
jgi:g-D-glutamyl-meso-diaminopimelate peptidase